jgi:beta-N-acetylhexosaminidase
VLTANGLLSPSTWTDRGGRWLGGGLVFAILTGCGSTALPGTGGKHGGATPAGTRPGATASASPGDASAAVPLERLAGQLVMAGMRGAQPDARLLQHVHDGEVGGVIIFGSNAGPGLAAALASLQHAAAAGGNPPLLISVDQEGGEVRRLPGPPVSPRSIDTAEEAQRQGEATGALLATDHINVDLAPVADVSVPGTGFEAAQGRGFAGDPAQVGALADAFARGLQRQRVAATAKHFPGIGSLARDTDAQIGHVELAADQLRQDMAPFRQLIADGVDIVMVANANYRALHDEKPAVFSSVIMQDLLRKDLGFEGVIITDGLDGPRDLPGDTGGRAVTAVNAGVDIVLFTPESDGPVAGAALVAAVRRGALPHGRMRDAYDHVVALKRRVVQ